MRTKNSALSHPYFLQPLDAKGTSKEFSNTKDSRISVQDICFVYITNPTYDTAREIARTLLEKRLISCANIYPITSLYWWEGKISEEGEVVVIGKTIVSKYAAVREAVELSHPYKIPCVIKLMVEANPSYHSWLIDQVLPRDSAPDYGS